MLSRKAISHRFRCCPKKVDFNLIVKTKQRRIKFYFTWKREIKAQQLITPHPTLCDNQHAHSTPPHLLYSPPLLPRTSPALPLSVGNPISLPYLSCFLFSYAVTWSRRAKHYGCYIVKWIPGDVDEFHWYLDNFSNFLQNFCLLRID